MNQKQIQSSHVINHGVRSNTVSKRALLAFNGIITACCNINEQEKFNADALCQSAFEIRFVLNSILLSTYIEYKHGF